MAQQMEKAGCLCGAIRFEVDREAIAGQAHCHCRDCQRSTGSAFASFCFVPESGFRLIAGEPNSFEVTAESGGKVVRSFCGRCGSQLFSQVEVMPGVYFVKAGSFEDATWMTPAMALWCESAQPWAPVMGEGVAAFDRNPG